MRQKRVIRDFLIVIRDFLTGGFGTETLQELDGIIGVASLNLGAPIGVL